MNGIIHSIKNSFNAKSLTIGLAGLAVLLIAYLVGQLTISPAGAASIKNAWSTQHLSVTDEEGWTITDISVVDDQTAWVAGVYLDGITQAPSREASVFRTIDGGQTWEEYPFAAEGINRRVKLYEPRFSGITAVDANTAFVGSRRIVQGTGIDELGIWKVSLGGGSTPETTWYKETAYGDDEPSNFHSWGKIAISPNGQWGLALGGDIYARIYKSDRDVSGWAFDVEPDPSNTPYTDLTFRDADTAFVIGENENLRPTLLGINNEGRDWHEGYAPYWSNYSTIEAIDFADNNPDYGWVIYSSSTTPPNGIYQIWRTTNGGVVWKPVLLDGESPDPGSGTYFDINFVDENEGWIVSTDLDGHPGVLHTVDGGFTWEPDDIDLPDHELRKVELVQKDGNAYGWAVGNNGSIIRYPAEVDPEFDLEFKIVPPEKTFEIYVGTPVRYAIEIFNHGNVDVTESIEGVIRTPGAVENDRWQFSTLRDIPAGGSVLLEEESFTAWSYSTAGFKNIYLDGEILKGETKTQDNFDEFEINVLEAPTGGLPNLYIKDVLFDPSQPRVGDEFFINLILANNGQVDVTEPFLISFLTQGFRSNPGTYSAQVDNDIPANNKSFSVPFGIPVSFGDSGLRTMLFAVNQNQAIEELTYDDNQLTKEYDAQPNVNLTVSNLRVTPVNPIEGQSFKVSIDIRNTGKSPIVQDFEVTAYSLFADPGYLIDRITQTIGAGETITHTFNGTLTHNRADVYNLTAVVDSKDYFNFGDYGEVDEFNEGDNEISRDLTIGPDLSRPDLAITQIKTEPTKLVVGDGARIIVTVKNEGNAPVPNTSYTIRQEAPGNDYNDPVTVGGPWTPDLQPGQSIDLDLGTSVQYSERGSKPITVTLDTNNVIEELNENNNFFNIEVEVGQPDLAIESLEVVSPSDPKSGDTVTFSAFVRNIGDGLAAPTPKKFGNLIFAEQDGDRIYESNLFEWSDIFPNIRFELRWSQVFTEAGTYEINVLADSNEKVLEIREDNNTLSTPLTLVVDPAPVILPDLVNISTTVSNPNPEVGEGVDITVSMVNEGHVDVTTPFVVELFFNRTNSLGRTSEERIFSGVLPAGATRNIVFENQSWTTPGTVEVASFVDSVDQFGNRDKGGNIEEEDETNNGSETDVTLVFDVAPEALPDLVNVSTVASNASPEVNEPITITVNLTNDGTADIDQPFIIELFLGKANTNGRTIEEYIFTEFLPVGASRQVAFTGQAWSTGGPVTVASYVDSRDKFGNLGGDIEELDESNNGSDTSVALTIDVQEPETYFYSGTHTTKAYDLSLGDNGMVVTYDQFTATDDKPVGTTVSYEMRSSDDSNNWSNWVKIASGNIPNVPVRRYVQFRETLTTDAKFKTPKVYDLNLGYTFDLQPEPDFILNVVEDEIEIEAGDDGSVAVELISIGGYNSPVGLSALFEVNVAGDVTETFDPFVVIPTGNSTLTMDIDIDAFESVSTVTVTGTPQVTGGGGGLVKSDTFILRITRPAPTLKPDVVVRDIIFDPAQPEAGEATQISFELENIGQSPVSDAFDIDISAPLSNLPTKTITYTGGLSIGQIATVVINENYVYGSNGNYTVTVDADVNNDIDENIEDNNDRTESLQIVVASLPDLIVTNLSYVPSSQTAEETFDITATVSNVGAKDVAGSFVVRLEAMGADAGSPAGKTISSLNIAESKQVTFEGVRYDTAGSKNLTVTADSNEVIEESNENNNTKSDQIFVNEKETFFLSGTHTTQPLDLGDGTVVTIDSFESNESIPANTTLKYEMRTSTDALNWSSWVEITGGDVSGVVPQRYGQIRSTLSTTEFGVSPKVYDYTLSYTFIPAIQPDFTLDVTDSTVTITAGGQGVTSVNLGKIGSYSELVDLSIAGLPSGVDYILNPDSLIPNGLATLILEVDDLNNDSTDEVTVTGTDGNNLTHSDVFTLIINKADRADFSIIADPVTLRIPAGGNGTTEIILTAIEGFSSEVSLTASGLASGLSHTFAPTGVTPDGSSVLTFTAAENMGETLSNVRITGTGGGRNHSVYVAVQTYIPTTPDFTLNVIESEITIKHGQSDSVTVDLNSLQGYNENVALTATGGQSDGAHYTFDPAVITPSGLAELNIDLSSFSFGQESYTVTVTGTDGTLTHSDTFILNVEPLVFTGEPDLTITEIEITSPDDFEAPALVNFNVKIKNAGHFDIDQTFINDYEVVGESFAGQGFVNELAAGETYEWTFSRTFGEAGDYGIETKTDLFNDIAESNENNNESNSAFEIFAPPVETGSFTVHVDPTEITIVAGNDGDLTVRAQRHNFYNGFIEFDISGLPSGVGYEFNPAGVQTDGDAILTLTVPRTANESSTIVTVIGTDEADTEETAEFRLNIEEAIPLSYTFKANLNLEARPADATYPVKVRIASELDLSDILYEDIHQVGADGQVTVANLTGLEEGRTYVMGIKPLIHKSKQAEIAIVSDESIYEVNLGTLPIGDIAGNDDGDDTFHDDIINSFDLARMLANWFSRIQTIADLDLDGIVNSFDYRYLIKNWGRGSNIFRD